jgi:hypothetical protein
VQKKDKINIYSVSSEQKERERDLSLEKLDEEIFTAPYFSTRVILY